MCDTFWIGRYFNILNMFGSKKDKKEIILVFPKLNRLGLIM